VGVFFLTLFFLGTVRLWRYTDQGVFFSLWLAVPILGTLSISAVTEMAYNVRYVAACLPVYVLILASGITGCR
jgi:hypothetical protein